MMLPEFSPELEHKMRGKNKPGIRFKKEEQERKLEGKLIMNKGFH